MKITETTLIEVKIIEPDVFGDSRGFFFENYSYKRFLEFGIGDVFLQDNHSLSKKAGTLRGLHFQLTPHAQAKLVRCTRGAILDVAVDIRKNSPTYCQWTSVELSAENFKQMYIPVGFAHGFVTLEDNTEVQYKTSDYYFKESERSIKWNDPSIGIEWFINNPILSEKDRAAPFIEHSGNRFIGEEGI